MITTSAVFVDAAIYKSDFKGDIALTFVLKIEIISIGVIIVNFSFCTIGSVVVEELLLESVFEEVISDGVEGLVILSELDEVELSQEKRDIENRRGRIRSENLDDFFMQINSFYL